MVLYMIQLAVVVEKPSDLARLELVIMTCSTIELLVYIEQVNSLCHMAEISLRKRCYNITIFKYAMK